MRHFPWLQAAVLAVPFSMSVAIAAEGSAPLPPDPTVRPSGQSVKPTQVLEAEKKQMEPSTAAPRNWVDEVKQPVGFFKWGADLRLRHEYLENAVSLDDQVDNESSYNRYRARTWFALSPVDNVSINNRWTWEGRYYWRPDAKEGFDDSYVILDQLNVDLKKLGGTDSSLTVGRQDISILDGWLVLDGTPLDGSRTLFFDAARTQIDLKDAKSKLDVIVLANQSRADDWSPIIMNDNEASLVEQDEIGGVVDFTNKSFKDITLDAFVMYKHAERVLANGDEADIFLLGARIEQKFNKNVSGRVAGAYEFGHKDNPIVYPDSNGDLSAFGVNSRVTYAFNDPMKNQLSLDFEYLSGDERGTDTNEGFDVMWGRWPRFSDLYVFTQSGETRIADYTNLFRVGPSYQVQPTQPLLLTASYYALFADERTYADAARYGDGYFRGHLFVTSARYTFNRYMSAALVGEYLLPGNYYSDTRQDNGLFVRAELVLTF